MDLGIWLLIATKRYHFQLLSGNMDYINDDRINDQIRENATESLP